MLTPAQTRLISAILVSPTIRAACRRAKVSERAYRKWKGARHSRPPSRPPSETPGRSPLAC